MTWVNLKANLSLEGDMAKDLRKSLFVIQKLDAIFDDILEHYFRSSDNWVKVLGLN